MAVKKPLLADRSAAATTANANSQTEGSIWGIASAGCGYSLAKHASTNCRWMCAHKLPNTECSTRFKWIDCDSIVNPKWNTQWDKIGRTMCTWVKRERGIENKSSRNEFICNLCENYFNHIHIIDLITFSIWKCLVEWQQHLQLQFLETTSNWRNLERESESASK